MVTRPPSLFFLFLVGDFGPRGPYLLFLLLSFLTPAARGWPGFCAIANPEAGTMIRV